jgi:uncharacterized membrane protein
MRSAIAAAPKRARTKTVIWLLVAAGLLLLVAANAHLVYVATASQPDCVAHLKQGQGDAARGLFSAAGSACTPE